MAESIKSIIEWSEQTFGDATLQGQIDKFDAEYDEYFEERDHNKKIKELADLFIVAFSICRFDMAEGLFYIHDAWELFSDSPYSLNALCDAIQSKMKTNRSRVWEKKDGQYQHVEE